MGGDDQADTELGVAPDAATAAREAVPPQAQEAWSVEDHAVDDFDHARAPWRRVAAIGGAIVLAAAVIAAGIVTWDSSSNQQQSAPVAPSPAPGPTQQLPIAPPWQLNGTYRYKIRNPEGIVRDAMGKVVDNMSTYGVPTAANWVAYETKCEPSGCTARSVKLDDGTQRAAALDESGKTTTTQFHWNGASWVSADNVGAHGGRVISIECDAGPQPDVWEVWAVLTPRPDGKFDGTSFREDVPDSCPTAASNRFEVPVTAARVGDAPPGIFR